MPRIFRKLFQTSAQNILEYMLLLVTVAAVIMIMGPYVVRSWNAGMKTYEESYVDSMIDPLPEGNIAPPSCVCINDTFVGCGLNGCDCSQESWVRLCQGGDGSTGCAPQQVCRPSTTCSCPDVKLPGCDMNADPRCFCGNSVGFSPRDCFDPATPPTAGNPTQQNLGRVGCPAGGVCYEISPPGGAPKRYECRPDTNCPRCLFSPGSNWSLCLGDNFTLFVDTAVRAIRSPATGGSGCSAPAGSAPLCEAECRGTFIPLLANGSPAPGGSGAVGEICGCPGNMIPNLAGTGCECNPWEILTCDSCADGTCVVSPGSCGGSTSSCYFDSSCYSN